jgi:hypothetical protein
MRRRSGVSGGSFVGIRGARFLRAAGTLAHILQGRALRLANARHNSANRRENVQRGK